MCNRPWEGVKLVWFCLSWPTSNLPHTFSYYWECNGHCYGNKPLLIHFLPHRRAVAEHVTCFLGPKRSIAVACRWDWAMTSRLNIGDAEREITVSCSGLRVGCLIILLDISGFWPHSLLFSDAGKMMNNKRKAMICFVSVLCFKQMFAKKFYNNILEYLIINDLFE